MNRLATAAIAAACGGVSACLYLGLVLGSPGALILVYLTQLPLFIAGLWLGAGAVAIAGLTASITATAETPAIAAAPVPSHNPAINSGSCVR